MPLLLRLFSLKRVVICLTQPVSSEADVNNASSVAEKIVKYTDYILQRNIWVYRPNCLKRSLILYYFLRKYGIDVQLHLGVKRTVDCDGESSNNGLAGHAWLVRCGHVFAEHPTVDVTR